MAWTAFPHPHDAYLHDAAGLNALGYGLVVTRALRGRARVA